MKKIALLAGVGRLPVEFAKAARGLGYTVLAISLVPGTEHDLAEAAAELKHISVGQLDQIIQTLKEWQVQDVTMIGKVTKELLYTGQISLDDRLKKLLLTLPNQNDDTLMLAFVRELAQEGLRALDQTELLRSFMPQAGVLTKAQPNPAMVKDMEFGLAMAKQLGGLDIGQTVVVKDGAVMAVEAIEGTDAAILRGGKLAGQGAIVAKAAKPQQDQRFDVPSVGLKTVESIVAVNGAGLVIEAGRTLLVDQEQVLALAEKHGLVIAVM